MEKGTATLSDRRVQLNVNGTEDDTTVLKPYHRPEIATKSQCHKTGISEKACKLRLKQTPTHLFDVATECGEQGEHREPEQLVDSCHQRQVWGMFLCMV